MTPSGGSCAFPIKNGRKKNERKKKLGTVLHMSARGEREELEEEEREGMELEGGKRRVCVTGAGGFAASWLVKLLLSKGFFVHGTVRDPGDEKYTHLKRLENALENLQLFKADLLDYNSIASAIAGCEGVFHVASPVPSTKVPNPEEDLLAPSVKGTLNVLKACSEAKIKRVVVVSSVVAIGMNPDWLKGKVLDESCWSDMDYCRATESWYFLSKTLAEREALDYAEKNGLDVVTVCPSLIVGPMLQSTVNSSNLVLINLIKGVRDTVDNNVRNIVDVRDVAEALLMVYENPAASGRYICSSHPVRSREMVDFFKSLYPDYSYPKNFKEVEEGNVYSSKKLQTLGWKFRNVMETLKDAIDYYHNAGLLK